MAVLIDDIQTRRAIVQNLPELTLMFCTLRLTVPQGGDVVNPKHTFTADETDVSAVIGSLRIRNQHMHLLAELRQPDRFLIQDCIGAVAQGSNNASSVIEVVPEFSSIKQMQLFSGVAEQLTNAPVVEKQPAVLVDDVQPCRAVFENFARLALVLCDIVDDQTVDWSFALVGMHLKSPLQRRGGILTVETTGLLGLKSIFRTLPLDLDSVTLIRGVCCAPIASAQTSGEPLKF